MKQNVLRKLPSTAGERKEIPIAEGVIDFFPLALAAIARCSNRATSQHHPGEAMHWDRSKSSDHVNCIIRHLIERDEVDSDGIPHIHKLAWRALAASQEYEERQAGWTPEPTVSIEEAEAASALIEAAIRALPNQENQETPWKECSLYPGYETRLNADGYRETRPIQQPRQEPDQMRLWNEAA